MTNKLETTTITITKEELDNYYIEHYQKDAKYKTGISGMSDIMEDLGNCMGVGGIYDEYWYQENIDHATDYVASDYNFESDMLDMDDATFKLLLKKIEFIGGIKQPKDDSHTLAAYTALQHPDLWENIIIDVRQAAQPYHDSAISALFPDFYKRSEDAVIATEKDMRHDFINGDYRGNFEGLEKMLVKFFGEDMGCEDAEISDKENSLSLTFHTFRATLSLEEWTEGTTINDLKEYCISRLASAARSYAAKREAEIEKNRVERERVNKYQKEQKEKAEAARFAKLDAIRKKK